MGDDPEFEAREDLGNELGVGQEDDPIRCQKIRHRILPCSDED